MKKKLPKLVYIMIMMVTTYTAFSCVKRFNNKDSRLCNLDHAAWSEEIIIHHLSRHSSRAYFADLFRKGGFKRGMEIGVADGRFSELFLRASGSLPFYWHMVEPYPNDHLRERFNISAAGTPNFRIGLWASSGIGVQAFKRFSVKMSVDPQFVHSIPDEDYDFIYLDGSHTYEVVKQELPLYFEKIRRGGVLAGHDYCNRGENGLSCRGCEHVPLCEKYTEYGVVHGKTDGPVDNQAGVVSAVQEWVVEQHPELRIHFTAETFTREGLKRDGFDYDLVITGTKNPSWFVVKPLSENK